MTTFQAILLHVLMCTVIALLTSNVPKPELIAKAKNLTITNRKQPPH